MALFSGRKFLKPVEADHVHRYEMALIAQQNCQVMPTCRRSNSDIGKARRMTTAARQIGQGTGNLSCRTVKGQHTIAIEMQHGSQPS